MRKLTASAVFVGSLCAAAVHTTRADFDVRGAGWMLEVVSEAPVLEAALAERGLRADWMHDTGVGARVNGFVDGDALGQLRGDACAALRLARADEASLDLLAGARVAASMDGAFDAAGADPMVALRARTELAPALALECTAGVVGGDGPVPEAEAILRARLDRRWTLGLSAGWRGESDGGWDGEPARLLSPEGMAFRIGISAEF